MVHLGSLRLFLLASYVLAGAATHDVLCEIVKDVAFVPSQDYVKGANATVSSAAACCSACRKAGLGAWTFDPQSTKTYNCMMLPNQYMIPIHTESRAGVFSGSNGACSMFDGTPNLCVIGSRTSCCDGLGQSLGGGHCYDPTEEKCCQNDLEHKMCGKTDNCCTYSPGECQPISCCSSSAPFCNNTDFHNTHCAANPPKTLSRAYSSLV